MATSTEKYQLVLEAREAAAAKIKKLNKQIKDLGGPQMVKSQREIKKLEGNLKRLNTTTAKSKPVFSRFTKGIALGNLAAMGMARALGALTRFIKGTFEAALHHEKVWNDVAASLARHRGEVNMNVESIKKFADSMQTLSGISDEVIGQAFQRLHDSNIDAAKSMDMTRLAMDLAAAKGMDVVMVADLMGKSINSSTNALSRYGIMIDKSLPKQDQMVQLQTQINDLFGGAAAARMHTTAGKIRLMAERMGDLQEAIGGVLTKSEAFTWFLDVVSDAAKFWGNLGANTNIDAIRAQIESVNTELDGANKRFEELNKLGAVGRIGSAYKELTSTISELETKLIDLQYREQIASDQAIKNIKREKAERQALNEERFTELKASLKLPDLATDEDALAEIDRFNESLRMMMSSRVTEPMLTAEDILPIDDIDAASKEINESVKGAITADIVSKKKAKFTAEFAAIGRSGVNSIARELASGRGKIGDVFKGMHEDFMALFIQKAIASIANIFIPGLGSLLGGMFDTPRYDRLAMEQGEHFAHYFAQGVFQNMRSGSEFMRGIVPSAGNLAMPAMAAPAPAASGASTINVTFSGNVLSSQFVEQQVAPMLRKLVTNGKSDLALTPENVTGGRNIRVY